MSGPPGADLGPRLWIAGAFLAGYVLFFHTTFLVPDSSGTYAWARSLLFDGDVDFTNDLARLGWIAGDDRVRFHAPTARGVPGNPFGVGSALLWAPFVLLAQAGLWLAGAAPSPAGFSVLHVLAASTGTVLWGLAAMLLSYAAARRFADRGMALAAVLAGAFGTPFLAYLYHLPTYAHVNAAFATALVLAAALAARDAPSPGRWALAGAAAGLAAAVRAQHAALLAIPLALWLPGRGSGRHREAASALALASGFAAALSVQIVAWWRVYGSLQVPQGDRFLDLARPHLWGVLFSGWHGLFAWAPVLLLALPGALALGRRDGRLAAGIGIALAAEVWIVASVPDWWGGYAVGARRLVDATPLFVVLLAASFGRLASGGRPRIPAAIAAVAVLWNLALTAQVRSGMLSPFQRTGFGELLGGQLRALARLPAYLGSQATAGFGAIHSVVHRDSPVAPTFDAAPGFLVPVVLGACWALGLAGIALVARHARGRRR